MTNVSLNDCGVLYVLWGDVKAREKEIAISVRTLREHSPQLPICLISDRPRDWLRLSNPDGRPDIYQQIDLSGHDSADVWATRIRALKASPWKYTLYLDTDTIICADVSPLFEMCDAWDMCAAPCFTQPELHTGQLMWNCGVLLYHGGSGNVDWFFEQWEKLYLNRPDWHRADQESFADVVRLLRFGIHFGPLHPRWNVRLNCAHTLIDEVGIVHCKASDAEAWAKALNVSAALRRHYIPGRKEIITKGERQEKLKARRSK